MAGGDARAVGKKKRKKTLETTLLVPGSGNDRGSDGGGGASNDDNDDVVDPRARQEGRGKPAAAPRAMPPADGDGLLAAATLRGKFRPSFTRPKSARKNAAAAAAAAGTAVTTATTTHLAADSSKRDSGLGTSTSVFSGRSGGGGSCGGSRVRDDDASNTTAFSNAGEPSRPSTASVPCVVVNGRFDALSPLPYSSAARLSRAESLDSPWSLDAEEAAEAAAALSNARISMDIPSGSLFDEEYLKRMAFSKRGSILLGGARRGSRMLASRAAAAAATMSMSTTTTMAATTTVPESSSSGGGGGGGGGGSEQRGPAVCAPSQLDGAESDRVLSADDEMLSQQVRLMYELPCASPNGRGLNSHRHFSAGQAENLARATAAATAAAMAATAGRSLSAGDRSHAGAAALFGSRGAASDVVVGEDSNCSSEGDRAAAAAATLAGPGWEDARGGLEDWEDLDAQDVDRYGFILARRLSSRLSSSSPNGLQSTPQRPQRVSTLLQLASETPRRSRALGRKTASPRPARSTTTSATTAATATTSSTKKKKKSAAAAGSSQPSVRSGIEGIKPWSGAERDDGGSGGGAWTLSSHPLRYAASRFYGSRSRRYLATAGDMLTLPPGGSPRGDRAGGGRAESAPPSWRNKESERADKWWKMARVVTRGVDGRGMEFGFDIRDPKLISRTWKGIPDRWRATAWHAFLSSEARERKGCLSDEQIVTRFYAFLEQSSADDVQIDLDVPRTINRHVLFRRRYRGGQRLLFRLLHSLSLYFPNTGYVQGMASLAATLLCYYNEETAFVMLVRLWELRGLERLYQTGFSGLLEALGDFEKNWLAGSDIARKLDELGIDATAYATRWYLTLFNYSIPFSAQLRVWDVFMLLGGGSNHPSSSSVLSSTSSSASAATAATVPTATAKEGVSSPTYPPSSLAPVGAVTSPRHNSTSAPSSAPLSPSTVPAPAIGEPTSDANAPRHFAADNTASTNTSTTTTTTAASYNNNIANTAGTTALSTIHGSTGTFATYPSTAAAAAATTTAAAPSALPAPTPAPAPAAALAVESGACYCCLDVVHAASTALMDGMSAILLQADFESAMKVLTSWIPIKDDDVFMKVVKAEWKQRRRQRRQRRR